MLATLDRRRRTSCSLLISRLNSPTLLRSRTVACSAMLSAKLDLPTDGRAASTIEVALLQTGGQRVQVGEPGSDAADLATMGVQVVEPIVRVVKERLQRAESRLDALLADREQLGLGAIDGLLDLRRVLVPDAGDPARGRDEIAQDGLALDDPRVLRDMDRGRRLVRQARQVGPAADRVKFVTPLERLGDGHDVDRLATLVEVEDRGVDAAVGLPVEVGGPEELRDLDDCVAIDEERARTDCSASRLCGGSRSITISTCSPGGRRPTTSVARPIRGQDGPKDQS